jgi:lipopolysaccharide transport system ATP-binding protein
VGSLLEVGTGFHPELTGRENIYLNGAILGMKKRHMDSKFDEIVAFAEIEKFIECTCDWLSRWLLTLSQRFYW